MNYEEEDGVKKFWQASGRGDKEAREEEKHVQTNWQGLELFLGKKSSRQNPPGKNPLGKKKLVSFFCSYIVSVCSSLRSR